MAKFEVKIIKDSLAENGRRLTTITATYPRFIHSEIMTHRDRARNAASSRAIPWPKMMAAITDTPVVPIRFGSEQRGMQTGGEIENHAEAERIWLEARDNAVRSAQQLAELGVHKSICNRLTEPWMWITVVMSATEWANFFRLRCHHDAEIHFQRIAGMIRDALEASEPDMMDEGDWHLPFVERSDIQELEATLQSQNIGAVDLAAVEEAACKISTARCARVSYLSHEGKRDLAADLQLFERLVQGSGFGHWSAHEHVATPAASHNHRSGPFFGWVQYRKHFANENVAG